MEPENHDLFDMLRKSGYTIIPPASNPAREAHDRAIEEIGDPADPDADLFTDSVGSVGMSDEDFAEAEAQDPERELPEITHAFGPNSLIGRTGWQLDLTLYRLTDFDSADEDDDLVAASTIVADENPAVIKGILTEMRDLLPETYWDNFNEILEELDRPTEAPHVEG